MAHGVGIGIAGVTKASCGDPEVAKAIFNGGAELLADSRLENIRRMKASGVESDFMLLRTPQLSRLGETVETADISLNSEPEVIEGLSREAEKRGMIHRVVLMAEMGDLREGIVREELLSVMKETESLPGVELYGVGMNLACFGGIVPTAEKVAEFEDFVERMEKEMGRKLKMISGGNSANIPHLMEQEESGRINNLRVGEGILLGLETVGRTPIPGTHQDAFTCKAEIIELKEKPSVPSGEISQNAFGEVPEFEDIGTIRRGIIAMGRQDVIVEDLIPLDEGVEILGSSSDHLICHIRDDSYDVGDHLSFNVKYGALMSLFTSSYVDKVHIR